MSSEQDFIAEIIENPNDEALRLIFADYLEEEGDPRAELIRLQFERQAMPRFDPQRDKLRKRELKILKSHGGFGTTPITIKAAARHGGFVDGVNCTMTRFLRHQHEIFSVAPIRYVLLTGISGHAPKFAEMNACPYLPRLAGLVMKGSKASTEQICELMGNPGWTQLHSFELRCSSDAGFDGAQLLESIVAAPALDKLEYLAFSGFTISKNLDLLGLLTSRLKTLRADLSNDQARILSEHSAFSDVESLDLWGQFSPDVVRSLQEAPASRKLEELVLASSRWNSPGQTIGVDAFQVRQPIPNLRYLTINMQLNNDVIEPICDLYPGLEMLDLSHNNLTDRAAERLANHPLLKNLRQLRLSQNQITTTGIRRLAESPYRHTKLRFYLQGNALTSLEHQSIQDDYGATFGNLSKHWSY